MSTMRHTVLRRYQGHHGQETKEKKLPIAYKHAISGLKNYIMHELSLKPDSELIHHYGKYIMITG